MTTFIVFLVALFAFMLIGLPLAFVLIICAIFMMLSLNQSDVMVIAQNMVSGTNSFALMAIPFFMLAGEIMDRGGLSLRIVKFAKLIVGRIRGGLGYTAILATIVFSGLSGSAVADAAALSDSADAQSLFVTPRNIDELVRSASKLIAYGIDLALHRGLGIEDIDALIE